ncbi:S-phase kinase-associated protein 1-like [Contarinia nasturtii]|uniref:S-phase kinase-associated protein 1-like n=1 Tax=Contarinia nasturtii TaxID=265458 RepID=UPI0012D39834|nr:S-phase kinase-associated protein 1-like [Contarinia nasturtii]
MSDKVNSHPSMESMIKLKSSDGRVYEIRRDLLKSMGTIEEMIQNFDENFGGEILLREVDSDMLEKVVDWAKNYNKSTNKAKLNFIKNNKKDLYSLINIANYLDFKDLMNNLCEYVADQMKDKSVDEIRKQFNMTERKFKTRTSLQNNNNE